MDTAPRHRSGAPVEPLVPYRGLMTTIYLRTKLTERQLGVLFDVSQK